MADQERPATAPNRLSLGTFPTPLEPMPRLAAELGLGPDDLWVKRDDLIGLGGGGNKIRKLERTLAELVSGGADLILTSGAPQSNHARLTAAAGARLGIPVVLVLDGSAPDVETGNLLLDRMLGARIEWAGDLSRDELEAAVQELADDAERAGRRPGIVPFGGSNATGARAYADAGHELLHQDASIDTVVVAVGSGGTMAGLVSALGPDAVLGVDCGAVPDGAERVLRMWQQVSGRTDTTIDDLTIRGDLVGDGYEVLSDTVRSALQTVARTEGIILDPVYTGRAAAGLIRAVDEGQIVPGARTVLLHSGGLPGLFGHPDAAPWREM
jgi:L-cysteate sulfo-lyase